MKTSWIIGIVMAYLIILACEMFATGGDVLAVPSGIQPTLSGATVGVSGFSGVLSSATSAITHVVSYFIALLGIFFLWSPTVMSGYMIWFWWFVCFPVDCGMVFGLITIARGVQSA